jgi:protein-S-isoprenylcysteine O-methyltransferase Ste14
MRALEARVPPVVIFLFGLGIIEVGVKCWPLWSGTPSLASKVLVGVLLVWGAILGAAGVAQFLQAKTTVHPNHPDRASVLVTGGIYRVTRNPMYLGLATFLAAYGFYRMHPAGLVAVLSYVAVITRLQIVPEERALLARFGPTYEDYKKRVRRWI